jgi:ketosteroid isomerase-like protein
VSAPAEAVSLDARARATTDVVERFHAAVNAHDLDAIMDLMTDDCVFDSTRPPPDGERIVGREAIRAFWKSFFERSPQARFETEEIFASGERCVVRWRYSWLRDGKSGHVRGIDVLRVRAGKVAEKLSYVKG